MENELFGTDGIRGVAGQPPLDLATVFAVGLSLGQLLRRKAARGSVILGEDTRESSHWIAETVAAGLREAAREVVGVGVITTPGLAYLTASENFAAGIMISASHNPYQDNGIKIIASTGFKLPEEDELEITREVCRMLGSGAAPQSYALSVPGNPRLVSRYVGFLRRAAGPSWSLPGWKLILDCANGSASAIAKEVFSGYGLEVRLLADRPNGQNINLHCGSLHMETLQEAVLREKADLGAALDGDADRALFVAANGHLVNGDGILWAASRSMREHGTLQGGAVVGTVMTNLGLEHALAREGLKLLRTPVGDKYVLEEMLRSGVNLGGEQSGHIIFLDDSPAGDGLLTALKVLTILAERDATLDELVAGLKVFPQTLKNIRVREKRPLEELPAVEKAIREATAALGARGRVIVRYSGTESLLRVMVEAETEADVQRWTDHICRAVESAFGS